MSLGVPIVLARQVPPVGQATVDERGRVALSHAVEARLALRLDLQDCRGRKVGLGVEVEAGCLGDGAPSSGEGGDDRATGATEVLALRQRHGHPDEAGLADALEPRQQRRVLHPHRRRLSTPMLHQGRDAEIIDTLGMGDRPELASTAVVLVIEHVVPPQEVDLRGGKVTLGGDRIEAAA